MYGTTWTPRFLACHFSVLVQDIPLECFGVNLASGAMYTVDSIVLKSLPLLLSHVPQSRLSSNPEQ